jgi:hypothetical protein
MHSTTAGRRIEDEIATIIKILDKDQTNAQYFNGALFGLRYALDALKTLNS